MNIKSIKSTAPLFFLMLVSPVMAVNAGSADGFISPDEITMDVIPAGKPAVILNRDENKVSLTRTSRPDDSPQDERDRERPEVVIPEVETPEIEIVREKEPPVCPRRS